MRLAGSSTPDSTDGRDSRWAFAPRLVRRRLVAGGAVFAAASLLASVAVTVDGSAAGAATKENDKGVVVKFSSGTTGTSMDDLAIDDGSFAKALKPLGATAIEAGTFSTEAPGIQALEGGSVDFVTGSITATVGALAATAPIKIFAWSPDAKKDEAILVPKSSSITSVKDLEGKTVAVNQAGTGQYMLDQALSYYHVPISSVHQAYFLAPNGLQAFQSGSVDAWATFATFIPLAEQNANARVLVWGGQVQTKNDTVYVVSSSFADKYPHLLKVIFGVLQKETAKVLKNPTLYDANIVAADHLAPAEVKFLNAANSPLQAVNPTVVKRWQGVANFFYKAGGVPTKVTIAGNTVDVDKTK
jgi:sulfonate transport system substrate-binding protein